MEKYIKFVVNKYRTNVLTFVIRAKKLIHSESQYKTIAVIKKPISVDVRKLVSAFRCMYFMHNSASVKNVFNK